MKQTFLILFCFLSFVVVNGQNNKVVEVNDNEIFVEKERDAQNFVNIRSYNYSLCLNISDEDHSDYIFDVYGELTKGKKTGSDVASYLYQGQEYSQQLGWYLFPERTYSPSQKRFVQPDPASQYFSPYCFIAGDPVNIIDKDGSVGYPIVLYSYEIREPSKKLNSAISEDILEHVDAYYIPLADFMEKRYPIPKRWNGNIYIEGHTNAEGDLFAEQYPTKAESRMSLKHVGKVEDFENGSRMIAVDNMRFGRRIAQLSEKTGVYLNNITFTGSEGDEAAQKIARGIEDRTRLMRGKQTFRTYGLKKGYHGHFLSLRKAKDANEVRARAGVKEVDLGLSGDMPLHYFVGEGKDLEDYKMVARDGIFYPESRATGERADIIRGQEFQDMAEGRSPMLRENFFQERPFRIPY